ncbi:protein lifeguard 2 isoform X2 [Folsomia candida]|uniref:protein lifeguard 2 isoform X2 n=1 Tax=Folsomia candida TaxID=158441 RepID=UPI000B902116|nr:protein lifeguard 2 isoform X2 [Folsomia candida]
MKTFSPNLDDSNAPILEMPDSPPPYSQVATSVPVIGCGPSRSSGHAASVSSPQPGDMESQSGSKSVKVLLYQSSKSQRSIFLRNVYTILAAQGIAVCGIISLFFIPHIHSYFQEMSFYIFWSFWAIGTIIACFVTTLYKLMRKPPVNLVMVTLVTISAGVIFGTLAVRVEMINPVLICIGIITGVCLSVVLFTFQDRYPYTPIISVFFVWTLLLVAFGGLFLSYGEDIVATFQLMIAPTLVSTYFAMTTQILVKDKEKAIMSNEYVYGAVQVSMYLVAVFAKIMYRIYSCCCPCCSCDNCGDICNEL